MSAVRSAGWLSQSISRIRSEQGEPTVPNSDRIHELAWNGFAAYVNSGGDPNTDGTRDQGWIQKSSFN